MNANYTGCNGAIVRSPLPRRIHIEGLDLAGKSTICRRLQAALPGGWPRRRNTLLEANPLHQKADQWRRSAAASDAVIGWFYLAALEFDLEHGGNADESVLQDSTILLRSLVYHTIQGTPDLPARFEQLAPMHPRFDRSIVCTASRETRLRRLAIRRPENLGPEDFLVRDDWTKFTAMESLMIEHAKRWFNAQVVWTDDLENDPELDMLKPVILGSTGT